MNQFVPNSKKAPHLMFCSPRNDNPSSICNFFFSISLSLSRSLSLSLSLSLSSSLVLLVFLNMMLFYKLWMLEYSAQSLTTWQGLRLHERCIHTRTHSQTHTLTVKQVLWGAVPLQSFHYVILKEAKTRKLRNFAHVLFHYPQPYGYNQLWTTKHFRFQMTAG